MCDHNMKEIRRVARQRDRKSAFVIGRALRGVSLPPRDADEDSGAGEGRTIGAVDHLELEHTLDPGRFGRALLGCCGGCDSAPWRPPA